MQIAKVTTGRPRVGCGRVTTGPINRRLAARRLPKRARICPHPLALLPHIDTLLQTLAHTARSRMTYCGGGQTNYFRRRVLRDYELEKYEFWPAAFATLGEVVNEPQLASFFAEHSKRTTLYS